MTRTWRLDQLDAARPGPLSRIRRYGRWIGRAVIVALAGLALWRVAS